LSQASFAANVAVNGVPAVAVKGELGSVTSKCVATLPPPAVTVV
jgi:hypothetical protein